MRQNVFPDRMALELTQLNKMGIRKCSGSQGCWLDAHYITQGMLVDPKTTTQTNAAKFWILLIQAQ